MSSSNSTEKSSTIEKIFGTADRVIVKGTHVDVVDFKFGRGAIDDADINVQGQAYLLGVMDKFPDTETAMVHFVVPRRDELLTHDYTREDMEFIRLRLRLIVDRATETDPLLNPTTDACRFCKHRVHCPALGKKLLPLAQQYDDGDKAFEVMLRDKLDPATIDDPEVIGKMKHIGFLLKSWMEAVDKKAIKLAVEDGEDIYGYDLSFRTPTAKVTDTQEAYEALQDILTPEEFMSACKVTVPALAKKLAEKKPRGQKKDARPEIEGALLEEGVLEEGGEGTPFLRRSSNL